MLVFKKRWRPALFVALLHGNLIARSADPHGRNFLPSDSRTFCTLSCSSSELSGGSRSPETEDRHTENGLLSIKIEDETVLKYNPREISRKSQTLAAVRKEQKHFIHRRDDAEQGRGGLKLIQPTLQYHGRRPHSVVNYR